LTGSEQYHKTLRKPANPNPGRRNTGSGYHGCLCIDVKQSRDLYVEIEGWAAAAMTGDRAA
jgi:hypothetical protein